MSIRVNHDLNIVNTKNLWLTKVSMNILNLRGFKWSFEALQLYFSSKDHLEIIKRKKKLSMWLPQDLQML